jgi:hypothetical protein
VRRATAAIAALALGLAAPAARAADDYPVCSGDLSAAAVAPKPGPALRVGITPRVQAGQVGPVPAAAVPEDRAKTMAALERLRPPGAPFVIRLNRFFWSGGEEAFREYLAEAERFGQAGYLVELQVRYHPTPAQEGDIAAWTKHVREVVRRFGAVPGVVALQIANEVNFDFSADSSDGAYRGARDAVVQGVIAAKDEARRAGMDQLEIGFNWAYRHTPANEQAFWDHLRRGGKPFVDALDWVGLDAYPGTFFPPAEATVEDYRDGMVNAMSAFRCYLRAAGIPDTVPIHVEENGWPTFGTRREEMQALVAEQMIRAVHDHRGTYNVTDYRWFNLRDGDTSDPAIGQHYGLMRSDYAEKQAFPVVARVFGEIAARGTVLGTRAQSGCLRRAGAVRRAGIGGARLGGSKADVVRRLGPPVEQGARFMRFCVEGGGRLLMSFDRAGRLRFAASTSFSSRVHRLRTGSSLRRVKRVYPRTRAIGGSLLRAGRGSRVVFGACGCGTVAFVAVTNVRRAAKLRYYAKLAHVPRAR